MSLHKSFSRSDAACSCKMFHRCRVERYDLDGWMVQVFVFQGAVWITRKRIKSHVLI